MFGHAGFAYVYPIHAKCCFNAVTQSVDQPSAVLIRALEPVDGLLLMQQRRRTRDLKNLCSGPSKLCQALGIDQTVDGKNLTTRRTVWIQSAAGNIEKIKRTQRIGVTSAKESELRFVIAGSAFASGPKYMR